MPPSEAISRRTASRGFLSDPIRASLAKSVRRGTEEPSRPTRPRLSAAPSDPGQRVSTAAISDLLPERDRDSAVQVLAELQRALATLAGGRDIAGLYRSLDRGAKAKVEAWRFQYRHRTTDTT